MPKSLYIIIPLLALLFLAKPATAGIIIRPVINTGLVGYWDFQEGSGNIAYDKSGYGNYGTLASTMTQSDWVDGKIGKALSFDGESSKVTAADNGSLNITGSLTISAWIKPTSFGLGDKGRVVHKNNGTVGYIFCVDDSNVNNGIALGRNAGNGMGNTVAWSSSNVITLGVWQHVIAIYNSTNNVVSFYVNGVPAGTHTFAGPPSASGGVNFNIGGNEAVDRQFDGLIDEVRIYNRALSESEIERLYKLSAPKMGINQLGLVPDDLPANATISYVREDCTGYSPCYNSLFTWEQNYGGFDFAYHSCASGNLTCLDKTAVAKIDGTWSSPDTTDVLVDGWTTDATRYIKIYTTASARHPGKWDETKYRLESTGGSIAFWTKEEYIAIDGLQIKKISTGSQWPKGIEVDVNNLNSDIRISNNIIRGDFTSLGGVGYGIDRYWDQINNVKVWNNIIYDFLGGAGGVDSGIYITADSGYKGTWQVYNNTIYNCEGGIVQGAPLAVVAKNNLSYNNVGGYGNYAGTFEESSTNNLSGPTQTNAPGLNSRNAAKVNFVNESNDDFHLSPADSGARNYGKDLSNDASISYPFDIDRQPRTSQWDIGADEARGTVANSSQNNQLTSGLVGFWSFNGPDMESGVAFDRSGNGNDGALLYGPIRTIGKVGQALDFDGVDDRVEVPHKTNLNITGPITISAWIYPRNLNGADFKAFVEKTDYGTSYYFGTDDLNTDIGFWYGGTQIAVTASDVLKLNQWQHVAVSYSSSGTDIYWNGTNVKHSNTTATVSGNNSSLYVGYRGDSLRCFGGKIDEVRIYNRALEPEEIRRLYNLGR